MSNNFQKTVNLREQAEQEKRQTAKRRSERTAPVRRSGQIGQVYNNGGEEATRKELQRINRPQPAKVNESLTKRIVIILAIIIVGLVSYWLFFYNKEKQPEQEVRWYSVELINGEVYYGQISDLSADPILLNNVYYNYDQIKSNTENKTNTETGNLRLVKRGKETHGPSGDMNIVRTQIVYMEELDNNSKVLQAILDYEN